jgi:hypothetical protein
VTVVGVLVEQDKLVNARGRVGVDRTLMDAIMQRLLGESQYL